MEILHLCNIPPSQFSLLSLPPLGTEPWSFYFINGFLNFNVAFVLALLALPLTSLMESLLQKFHGECCGVFLGAQLEATV